jgi:hypothetical protein
MKKILSVSLTLFIIHSSFSQQENSTLHPYSLNWNTDGWIIGSSVVVGGIAYSIESNLAPPSTAELLSLNKTSINFIDRWSAGNYNKSQSSISDVLVGVSIAAPLSLMLDEDIQKEYLTLGVMYIETASLAAIAPSLGKGIAKRIRPYVYSTSTPNIMKIESDAQRSFFSRHSTFAFSLAVSMSIVYDDYFPNSRYSSYVWISSLGLATTVAALRVTSGSHFVSDVVVGAVVGSGIGYLIPYIHRTKSDGLSLVPNFSPYGNGVAVRFRF